MSSVTKDCAPDPVEVGEVVTCTIVVTNTGSADSPDLTDGTIIDTLTGDLLDAANPAVASSDCTAVLPTGGTARSSRRGRCWPPIPDPLVNTVTVHYNPDGFPNDITATATDSVDVIAPAGDHDRRRRPMTLSKVGDPVTYTIEICNDGTADHRLNRDFVTDSLLGDITASFPATLAPGACARPT